MVLGLRPSKREKEGEKERIIREHMWGVCRVEIIKEHGQDVQMFINDQQSQIIIITGRTVETGAAARPGGLRTARRHHVR